MDGFQYKDGELQFFPVSEGYVRKTEGNRRQQFFDYVYNYTDHLGNIRLSYTTDPISGSTSNIKILEENNYYPFGLQHGSYNTPARDYRPIDDAREVEMVDRNPYKYKYNAKEYQDELGLDWYDYGARNYDTSLGRWNVMDNLSETYSALTPYNYAGNTPVQAIDIDGNLFIFVNGYMNEHYMAGMQPKFRSAGYGSRAYPNPAYSMYAPDRGFYRDGARNNGQTFRYWSLDQAGNDGYGVNNLYQDAYNDHKAYYTNGSYTPRSTAQARFKGGVAAGKELIKKLESGEITLVEGETIKIVGHSQGAAHAAGMASELIKHSVYDSRLEFVDYIAAHQPKDFESPEGVQSRQFLSWSDWVAGGWSSEGGMITGSYLSFLGLNGGSENGCIKNVTSCQERESYSGGRGGHSVNTYLHYIADYFRSLGINVNVFE